MYLCNAACAAGGAPLDWPQLVACLPPASQALAAADASRWTFITQARGCEARAYFLANFAIGLPESHVTCFIRVSARATAEYLLSTPAFGHGHATTCPWLPW